MPLPYPAVVHDFALSGRYAAFYLSPYLLDLQCRTRGGRTTMESLSWQPHLGSLLLLLERETGTVAASVSVGRRYCLHLINAYDADGRVTVDVLEYERPVYDQYQGLPELYRNVPACRPVRFVVDVAGRALLERKELPCEDAPDFPTVAAGDERRPYRYFWAPGITAAGRPGQKLFDQIVRRDWSDPGHWDAYRSPPDQYFGGQPAFLGHPASPEDGVVVSPLFDARRIVTSFAFFRALSLAEGPVATVPTRHPNHLGFHSTAVPGQGLD